MSMLIFFYTTNGEYERTSARVNDIVSVVPHTPMQNSPISCISYFAGSCFTLLLLLLLFVYHFCVCSIELPFSIGHRHIRITKKKKTFRWWALNRCMRVLAQAVRVRCASQLMSISQQQLMCE